METNSSLHETVLADFHVAHGARMVPFAGKRHHARAMRDVEICQYGFVKRGIGLHGVSPVQTRQKGIRVS